MNEIIKQLIDDCLDEYKELCKTGGSDIKYGIPPESLMIFHIEYYNMGKITRLGRRISAWNYKNGELTGIPTSAKPDTKHISGMYFSEAYAEIAYDGKSTAFCAVYMGQRFARCYRYDCVSEAGRHKLENKKVVWVS